MPLAHARLSLSRPPVAAGAATHGPGPDPDPGGDGGGGGGVLPRLNSRSDAVAYNGDRGVPALLRRLLTPLLIASLFLLLHSSSPRSSSGSGFTGGSLFSGPLVASAASLAPSRTSAMLDAELELDFAGRLAQSAAVADAAARLARATGSAARAPPQLPVMPALTSVLFQPPELHTAAPVQAMAKTAPKAKAKAQSQTHSEVAVSPMPEQMTAAAEAATASAEAAVRAARRRHELQQLQQQQQHQQIGRAHV